LNIKILEKEDARNFLPTDRSVGIYYVVKKNTIATFSFGKDISSFETVEEAFAAMQAFMAKRKDAELLNVTFLNNHF